MADMEQIGRTFVIRPFGEKENKKGESLDFDTIHNQLIEPALREFGLAGGTTVEFIQQGSIHEDMFREIISADLVIADVSIHNANTFYELGIRHALRNHHTIMIRADTFTDEHPFDLQSDRYFEYSIDNPASSLDELITVIRDTIENESGDSPVYRLLPGLTPINPAKVMIVPNKFLMKLKQITAEFPELLAELKLEVYGKPWEREGIREIARRQSGKGQHLESTITWEEIRKYAPNDIEANQCLATHYQKLGNFSQSKQAAEYALSGSNSGNTDRAETLALIASNYKTEWRQGFHDLSDLEERQKTALQSSLLPRTLGYYQEAFEHHLNHFYSGLNAVSMLTMQIELACLHPQEWQYLCSNDKDEARLQLKRQKKLLKKLKTCTLLAIESATKKDQDDKWAKISMADLTLLSSKHSGEVTNRYSWCRDTIQDFKKESLSTQLELYQKLGLFKENVQCALKVLDSA